MPSVQLLVDWVLTGQDNVDLDLAKLQIHIEADDLTALVTRLLDYPNAFQEEMIDQRLATVLANCLSRQEFLEELAQNENGSKALRDLYEILPAVSVGRGYILAAFARQGSGDDFEWFVHCLVTDPPSDQNSLSLAFVPLFHHATADFDYLFQKLFSRLDDSVVSNLALDLANHRTREGGNLHAAIEYRTRLSALVDSTIDRLETLQRMKVEDEIVARANATVVGDAVALLVSLSDAIGFIGDRQLIPSLQKVLGLGHRRLRCEAAAALARLEDQQGKNVLIQLAAEPVVRLRVLQYAEELGLVDQIDGSLKNSVAVAEAELVTWLASPDRFGIAPQQCELLDRSTHDWPGFDQAIEVMLFNFSYRSGTSEYSNVALVRPAIQTFRDQLSGLAIEDCYCIFAGFDLDQDEVFHLPVNRARSTYRIEIENLERSWLDSSASIDWIEFGLFFGEPVLLGQSLDGSSNNWIAWDGKQRLTVEAIQSESPLTASLSVELFWFWFVGKRLFDSFAKIR